jgi:hypothetical protein
MMLTLTTHLIAFALGAGCGWLASANNPRKAGEAKDMAASWWARIVEWWRSRRGH